MTKKTIYFGVLIFVLLISGTILITFTNENLKMRIDEDKSTFYVLENSRWVVSGREVNALFDGSTKLNRDKSSIKTESLFDNLTSIATITRHTEYIRGPIIIDTYVYRGDITDKELFPISHQVEVFNGEGYIYQYEVQDLVYSGVTLKDITSPKSFGRAMKVEWDDGNYYSRIYKYVGQNKGKLTIKYRPQSDYEVYNVRLFDPDSIDLTLEGLSANVIAEMGSVIAVAANITPSNETVCVDIDHHSYGVNYSCSNVSVSIDFNVSNFRTITFNDTTTAKNLTYTNGENQTVYVAAHNNDEVSSLFIDIAGYLSNGTYPEDVVIYIDDTLEFTLGDLADTVTILADDNSSEEFEFTAETTETIGHFSLLKNRSVVSATVNLTGSGNGGSVFRQAAYKTFNYNTNSTYVCYSVSDDTYYFNTDGYLNITYGMPGGVSRENTSWQVKHGDAATYNITLPAQCWNASGSEEVDLRILFKVNLQAACATPWVWSTQPQCFNGTGWNNTGTFDNESASEGYETSNTNATLNVPRAYDDDYGTGILLPIGIEGTNVTDVAFDEEYESTHGFEAGNFYEDTMYWDVESLIFNPHLNVGADDDSYEWNLSRDYMSTDYTTADFAAAINTYLDSCTADANGFCDVPIIFYTSSAGNLTISNISISYGAAVATTIELTASVVQAYVDSQSGATNIPIKIGASSNGTVEIDNIKYTYAGGNKTYAVLAHTIPYDVNVTYNATLYYSDYYYNLSPKIDEIAFYPGSPTVTSLQPFGQSSAQPMVNITMENYGGVDANFSLYLNNSYSCVELYYNINSTKPTLSTPTTIFELDDEDVEDSTDGVRMYLRNYTPYYTAEAENGVTWGTGRQGTAARLDGTNDYLNVSAYRDLASDDNWTIMLWVKPDVVTAGEQELVDLGGARLYQNGTSLVYAETTTAIVSDVFTYDTWTHIAVTRNATGEIKIYQDRQNTLTSSVTVINPGAYLYLGIPYPLNTSDCFDGMIDSVKIFNDVLTEAEIRNEMDAAYPTTISHITDYWLMDETTGSQSASNSNYLIGRDGVAALLFNSATDEKYILFNTSVSFDPSDGRTKISFWINFLDTSIYRYNYILSSNITNASIYENVGYIWVTDDDDEVDQSTCRGDLLEAGSITTQLWNFVEIVIEDNYTCAVMANGLDVTDTYNTLSANFTFNAIGQGTNTSSYMYGGIGDITITQETESTYLLKEEWEDIKTSLSDGNIFGIWFWADYACYGNSNWYSWQPDIYMRACCETCVCDEVLS